MSTLSLTQRRLFQLRVPKGWLTIWGVRAHSVLGDTLRQCPDLRGFQPIILVRCLDLRGESPTALPAAPKRTVSHRVLQQGSFYILIKYELWSFQIESTDRRPGNRAWALRHQIAMGCRPGLYQVLVQAPVFCESSVQAILVSVPATAWYTRNKWKIYKK